MSKWDPQGKSGKGHCIYLDARTTDVLRRLSNGRASAFIRTLIWQENGRHLERQEAQRAEATKP